MSHNMAVKTVTGSSSRTRTAAIRKAKLPSRSPSTSSILQETLSDVEDEDESNFSIHDEERTQKLHGAKRRNSRPPPGSSPKRNGNSSRTSSLMQKFTAVEDEEEEEILRKRRTAVVTSKRRKSIPRRSESKSHDISFLADSPISETSDRDHLAGVTTSPVMAEEESDERSYEVEAVVGKKGKGSSVKYQVKWLGYQETSWQPISDMEGSKKAIEDFEERQRIKRLARAVAKKKNSPKISRISSKPAASRPHSSMNSRKLLLQPALVERSSSPDVPLVSATIHTSKKSPVIPRHLTKLLAAKSPVVARSPTPDIILQPIPARNGRHVSATELSASPQHPSRTDNQLIAKRQMYIKVAELGESGVEIGHNVVMILGHKPKKLTIRRMEDVDFLVNYAGESDNEYVPYETCLHHIPAHVVDYMARNLILKCSCQHRYDLPVCCAKVFPTCRPFIKLK